MAKGKIKPRKIDKRFIAWSIGGAADRRSVMVEIMLLQGLTKNELVNCLVGVANELAAAQLGVEEAHMDSLYPKLVEPILHFATIKYADRKLYG